MQGWSCDIAAIGARLIIAQRGQQDRCQRQREAAAAPEYSAFAKHCGGRENSAAAQGCHLQSAYELGPASKLTLSTSSDAFLRNFAMFSSGSGSGFNVPQLFTIWDGSTFGLTGYSLLAVA